MLSPELRQRLANLSTALLADARVRLKLPKATSTPASGRWSPSPP